MENPVVDFYFNKDGKWINEVNKLRAIILECGLNEELKWGCPCYVYNSANIVLIHVFKDYCALLFFKGVFLNDPDGLLVQQTKNVQSARQLRFTNLRTILELETTLKDYIYQAVEVEKAGLKVEMKETSAYTITDEFQFILDRTPMLKTAFEALTPGRQKAYLLYFAAPKQSKTREARVMKWMPQILNHKGLND